MAKNRIIGKDNKLPWHIPEDMKYFRETTKGKIVIMGRKSWESIGCKPLPKRLNIVITRDQNYKAEGAVVTHSVEESLERARAEMAAWDNEVFVLGGAEIYKVAMPYLKRIYLTEIDQEFEGDTKFPEFDKSLFKLVKKTDHSDGPIHFAFCLYERV